MEPAKKKIAIYKDGVYYGRKFQTINIEDVVGDRVYFEHLKNGEVLNTEGGLSKSEMRALLEKEEFKFKGFDRSFGYSPRCQR